MSFGFSLPVRRDGQVLRETFRPSCKLAEELKTDSVPLNNGALCHSLLITMNMSYMSHFKLLAML